MAIVAAINTDSIAAMVGCGLALILGFIIALGWVSARRERRHRLEVLAHSKCPGCGKQYGPQGARDAQLEEMKEYEKITRMRLEDCILAQPSHCWPIVCSHCSLPVTFRAKTLEILTAEDERRLSQEVDEMDDRLTPYSCPHCGKPCPPYRYECRHCGVSVPRGTHVVTGELLKTEDV